MISSIGSQTTESLAAAAGGNQDLGQVEFLNLLIAQMQYQDPLEPMEGTQFITQLAQFSELDEMRNTSEGIETLQNYMASLNNFSALSLLGQDAEFVGDSVAHDAGTRTDLRFQLGEEAKSVTVNLLDASGALVRTFSAGSLPAGSNTVTWDGLTQAGLTAPGGVYRLEVEAVNANGEDVQVSTVERGSVDRVEFRDGLPYLLVNGQWRSLDAVLAVGNHADTEA